jgi:uncharacterized protein YbjT (DUF2867 family)
LDKKILIIGASGFIGSHLLHKFEKDGVEVKVMARTPQKVLTTSLKTEVFYGDLEKEQTLANSINQFDVIYYLAHGMSESSDHFIDREKLQATNLAKFLTSKQRVIYLGGIIPDHELSEHLKSREAVGAILRGSHAKVLEFRASIVIGKGSASFEMIRALVSRLPFILNTSWMHALCQPIALSDVLNYLTQAATIEMAQNHEIYNIGGSDQLRYGELVARYAKSQSLFRPTITIADFPKELASDLLKIVAPEYYEVGRKLLESIEHETIVKDELAKEHFHFIPKGLDQALSDVAPTVIANISFVGLLEKLKQHETLPQYLTGQVLQSYFEIPAQLDFYQILQQLNSNLPLKIPLKDEIELKIPFTGVLKITYHQEKRGLLLSYAPKYFFQSMGWVLWDQILKSLKDILSKYK